MPCVEGAAMQITTTMTSRSPATPAASASPVSGESSRPWQATSIPSGPLRRKASMAPSSRSRRSSRNAGPPALASQNVQ